LLPFDLNFEEENGKNSVTGPLKNDLKRIKHLPQFKSTSSIYNLRIVNERQRKK
jgi:hypothetical protein